MIKRRSSRPAPSCHIESLENRTFLSAGGVALPAVAKATTPSTATVLQFSRHVVRLGQNLTVNVKVGAAKGSAAPTGTVEILSGSTPVTTLNGPLQLSLDARGTASYTFAAGNLEFFGGIYRLKAEYLGDTTHPAGASKSQILYVVTPPFRKAGKDGLEISTVSKGHGATVVAGNTVQLAYTGLLASNGSIFDYATGHGVGSTPYIQFVVEANPETVIKGFDQGTLGMKIGETRDIFVPSALGYGAFGSPPNIPGNADLIFIVTLLKIV